MAADESACIVATQNTSEGDVQAILDDLDKQVQDFRRRASNLQEERLQLVRTLDTLSQTYNLPNLSPCEQEEISIHVNRLMYRCLTVDISIETPRSEAQESAFKQALEYMDRVKAAIDRDADDGRTKVSQLLNACSSDEIKEGPVDAKFQSYLLGCALDDQKEMKKTLVNWKETLSKSSAE